MIRSAQNRYDSVITRHPENTPSLALIPAIIAYHSF